jgi:hypothetical protein
MSLGQNAKGGAPVGRRWLRWIRNLALLVLLYGAALWLLQDSARESASTAWNEGRGGGTAVAFLILALPGMALRLDRWLSPLVLAAGAIWLVAEALALRSLRRINVAGLILRTAVAVTGVVAATHPLLQPMDSQSAMEISERRMKKSRAVAHERFVYYSREFQKPQRIVGVADLNQLILEDGSRVVAYVADRGRFESFAKQSLVGQEVELVLRGEDFFLDHYCCRGQGQNRDLIWAEVYLGGRRVTEDPPE